MNCSSFNIITEVEPVNDKTKEIEVLIDKAAKAHDSADALRFSQAACNAANAVVAMKNSKNIP
ncbi:hypothetical protein EVC27_095 [Rhizobium phage RHph_I1_6]|uniref:Uncharacterized protein n=1 Tax=Rhizobium phage RHph_I1_6 TaxID=2509728 RepID=A0A7S5RFK3_9CAUD|nr:hypothetical protein PP745_gp096 [Rhizobium phage RHph_I1_6]QIG76617.1 hypothetical protein EVC27_095 [Rhizobium phage RHph_I1_6]